METNTTPTVAEILDRYEADCLPSLAPRTARDYKRHLGHLKRWFGVRIASELKPKDFAPFLYIPPGKKGQVQRVRQLAVLSAAFTQAVSFWFILDHNVLRDVKRPKRPPRDRLIEDSEFDAVHSQAPLRVQLMMDLAVRLGQRQGDLLNLKWLDIREGFIHLQQAKTGKRLAIEITPELKRSPVEDPHWMDDRAGCSAGSRHGSNPNMDRQRAARSQVSGAQVVSEVWLAARPGFGGVGRGGVWKQASDLTFIEVPDV